MVEIEPGVYRMEDSLVLGPEDSGLRLKAGKGVVLSGARLVTGWRSEADGTWSAPVDWVDRDAGQSFRMVCVNGAPRQRARLPKKGYFTILNDDLPTGTRYNTPRPSFFYDPKEFKSAWRELSNAEIICYHFWSDSHLRIASVDSAMNKVTFVVPAGKAFDTGWTNNKSGGARGIYVVENIPDAMTEPGEWWLDYRERRLHYRPMPGEELATVVAEVPYVRTLVRIAGNPQTGHWAEDIVLDGVEFCLSQFELRPNDTNDRQGADSVSAAVELKGARNCRVENCSFSNLSGYAVDVLAGSRDNLLAYCVMKDLGAGGVRIDGGGWGCHPSELTSGNVVSDCEIGPFGRDFRSAVGVFLKNAEKTKIVHNHIFDGWYTGISVGWVWGYYPSVSRWNEISHNHIHDIGQGCLSDMGGIYMLGPSAGTRVANNRIHNVNARAYGGWGIYNDEGSTDVLIEENVVYDTKYAAYDIHYARDITVRNNIFAFGMKEQLARTRQEKHVSCSLENNIFYWTDGKLHSGDWNDAAEPYIAYRRSNVQSANKLAKTTFESDRNVFYNPFLTVSNIVFGVGKSFAEWQKLGKDRKSVFSDPLFVDVASRDFRLRPESPAYKLGFRDFDQDDVGPRQKKGYEILRALLPCRPRTWEVTEGGISNANGRIPGVRPIWVEGEAWQGRQTRIFAWWGVPDGASVSKKVPAMVLVHGGGGTAFASWVKRWTERGYAAIAMDTCGGAPRGENDGKPHPRHPWSGPYGWEDVRGYPDGPMTDQWPYQAVSAIMRCHSFLRSLPEVDAERIGITGISWGGYLTSLVMGVDHRFKFAAPIYGCGWYDLNAPVWRGVAGGGERFSHWVENWDAKHLIGETQCPVLRCNGNLDVYYTMEMTKLSTEALPRSVASNLSIKHKMPHGHPPAGDPREIFAWADYYLKNASKPLSIADANLNADKLTVWLHSTSDMGVSAELLFVVDVCPVPHGQRFSHVRKWTVAPVAGFVPGKTSFTADIPKEARMFFVNVKSASGLVATTPIFKR